MSVGALTKYGPWGRPEGPYHPVVEPVADAVARLYGLEDEPERVLVCEHLGMRNISLAGTCLGHVLKAKTVAQFAFEDPEPQVWTVRVADKRVEDLWPQGLAAEEVRTAFCTDIDNAVETVGGAKDAAAFYVGVNSSWLGFNEKPYGTMTGPKNRAVAVISHLLCSTQLCTAFEEYHRARVGEPSGRFEAGVEILAAAMSRAGRPELVVGGVFARRDKIAAWRAVQRNNLYPADRYGEILVTGPDGTRQKVRRLGMTFEREG